jgi:uncharacterized membrane protein
MEEHSSEVHGQVSVCIDSAQVTVAPGGTVSIPVLLEATGEGTAAGLFELSVRGVPSNWVSVPAPVIRLAPGEQREVLLTVQPPAYPQTGAGRYTLVVRAASQKDARQAAEAACTLTVAALEVTGRIGLLLVTTEFQAEPGGSTTIPLVILNQGLEADLLALSVEGIPSTWVSTPTATVRLAPGQAQEVSLTVQPPRSLQTSAGRHPLTIRASSQAAPGQVSEAACTLTITTFGDFSSQLRPDQVEAGQPARVMVENQGNIQQAFTLTWHSPNDELVFEPAPAQELRVPPGELVMAEFRATPRKRPFFGGAVTFPFTTRVQSADQDTQNLSGEVVSKALVPSWVLPAVLVAIMALACLWAVALLAGSGSPDAAPTQPPAATEAPPVEATAVPPPEQPTEAPPPEQPTEPPPPEQPTEPPPPEQPTETPEAVQLPEEGGGGLPCAPIGAGLILAPLLVLHRRRQ